MTKRGGRTGRQDHEGRSGSAARRVTARCARVLGLFAVVLLVVGVGVAVRSPAPQAPVLSASQRMQIGAEDRYRALADAARATATAEPAQRGPLTAIAADLDTQAEAVALPRSPAMAGGTDGALALPGGASDHPGPAAGPEPSHLPGTGPGTQPGTDPGARPDPAGFLTMLRGSALSSLGEAADADPGPARVLAAAGVNQWHHTILLARALGVESGLPPADGVAGPDPGARTTAQSGCTGAPSGSDADRGALLDAQEAEDRARYGYEVAAALVPDPAGPLTLSLVHADAADAAAARLADLCVAAAPSPAGFSLDPGFRTDPAAAVRELEQDHAEFYAGLVGGVGPDLRGWAVASFHAAAQRSLAAGTVLVALPGLDTGTGDGSPAPVPAPPDGPSATGSSDG